MTSPSSRPRAASGSFTIVHPITVGFARLREGSFAPVTRHRGWVQVLFFIVQGSFSTAALVGHLASNLEPQGYVAHRAVTPMMNRRVVATAQRAKKDSARRG